MSEIELTEHLILMYHDWGIEDADEGDTGLYVWCNGGYLPNCYQTHLEALQAIKAYFEGGE